MSWDDILQDTDGCLFLETHIYQSTGKQVDEWALCAYDTHHRLRIKALDHYATAPIAPPPPQHTQVPFNLHETPQQRERRDQVPLPFAYQLQDATPPSSSWNIGIMATVMLTCLFAAKLFDMWGRA